MPRLFDMFQSMQSPQGRGQSPSPFRPISQRMNFQPPPMQQNYMQPQEEEEDPYAQILKRYRSVLDSEQPALGAYRNAISNFPTRENAAPNWKDRLSAALLGFSAGYDDPSRAAPAVQQRLEQPYQRAIEQYQMNIGNLGQQAELERFDRSNRLKGLETEIEAIEAREEMRRKNLDTESLIELREAQGQNYQSQIGNRTARLDLDERQMQAQGWSKDYDFRGNIIWTNPRTGETRNTGMSSMEGREADQRDYSNQTGRINTGLRERELGETQRYNRDRSRLGMFNLGRNLINDQNQPASGFINPSQQSNAEEAVMDEMYRDYPHYRESFFMPQETDSGIFYNLRDDLDADTLLSPEYEEFMNEFRSRVDDRLNKRRGSGSRPSGGRYIITPGGQ